jgi:hypothetical protein
MLTVAAAQANAEVPEPTITARFLFPVSVLCGASSEDFQEGVVTGAYQTVIHVLNPSADEPVQLAKAVVRSLPYQAGLPSSGFVEDSLKPGATMAIECNELRQRFPQSMSSSFRSGYLVLYSDREIDVSVGYSAGPRNGEITTQSSAKVVGQENCPLSVGEAGDQVWTDKICLDFAWTCDEPEALSVSLDGAPTGAIPLNMPEDYPVGDGSSTFCASTTELANGSHTLEATLSCARRSCTLAQPIQVENTPFRLISVTTDKKRYRGSDTIQVTVVLSESVDEVNADFTILDTGFEEDPLTIAETDTPGTYEISYNIAGFDNTNPPGIYQVPLSFREGTVTRAFNGLRVGYVGETDNLLAPTDHVATVTVVGRMPTGGTSSVEITELEASNSVILPLTSVTVTGTVEAPFITNRPRAEVEAAAPNYTLIWRETDTDSAGAYRLRPAMLTFECAHGGMQLCSVGHFSVELGFPAGNNALAKSGPHEHTLSFAIIDPGGGVSEAETGEVTIAPLTTDMFSGTPQGTEGTSEGGTVGAGVDFRLPGSAAAGEDTNPLTLILTWDGENGPGADVIPGEDEFPQTLDALDLNIGLHLATGGGDGHGGWFGNTGNAELLRKSNTCFSGTGLGQLSSDRSACVCSDASSINMEVMAYPPGVEFDEGGDGEGNFGAEYCIYDSCGSQQDTIATLTAYYCGTVQQESFVIDAHLSEENEELDDNWGNPCPFGGACLDPKNVPTGFNETGGFYHGFDFNPNDCSERPVVAGHVGYKAPINFALNDPSGPGAVHDDDPDLDTSWAYLDPNLSETGWTDYDAPFTKIEVSLVDGTREEVGQTFTDEDGNFSLILDPGYAADGVSGLVRVEAVALSATPHSYRVIQDVDDLDVSGTDVLHRARLANNLDPVANAGAPINAVLNDGPNDSNARMEHAAAFNILRNTTLAAMYIQSLGRFVGPFTAIYDRDSAWVDDECNRKDSFYRDAGRYAHYESSGSNVTKQVCAAQDQDGVCTWGDDRSGATYKDSRVDFSYATHLHEYSHHVANMLTMIDTWSSDSGRPSGSHGYNTSEKSSLNEGFAAAFGTMLGSKLIYEMFGPGQPMNAVSVDCTKDDITNCALGIVESMDWLTTRGSEDDRRPGPDWQPQKDCNPGTLGCGCFLGTCADAAHSCQGGYCVDPSGACTPGEKGCVPDLTGVCA